MEYFHSIFRIHLLLAQPLTLVTYILIKFRLELFELFIYCKNYNNKLPY